MGVDRNPLPGESAGLQGGWRAAGTGEGCRPPARRWAAGRHIAGGFLCLLHPGSPPVTRRSGFPAKTGKDPPGFVGLRPSAESERVLASAAAPYPPAQPSRAFNPPGAGGHPAPLRKVTLWVTQTPFRFLTTSTNDNYPTSGRCSGQ